MNAVNSSSRVPEASTTGMSASSQPELEPGLPPEEGLQPVSSNVPRLTGVALTTSTRLFGPEGCLSGAGGSTAEASSRAPAQQSWTNHASHVTHGRRPKARRTGPVSYTHLRSHETDSYLVCRLLLEKKKKKT